MSQKRAYYIDLANCPTKQNRSLLHLYIGFLQFYGGSTTDADYEVPPERRRNGLQRDYDSNFERRNYHVFEAEAHGAIWRDIVDMYAEDLGRDDDRTKRKKADMEAGHLVHGYAGSIIDEVYGPVPRRTQRSDTASEYFIGF